MARIKINKEKKREELAYKAYEFILSYGLGKFSTNSFLKYLNMGKSSFYHYYKSKDEVIFEMLYHLTIDYFENVRELIKKDITFKEKLKIYFSFYLVENEENKEFRKIYKEFLYIKKSSEKTLLCARDIDLLEKYKGVLDEIIKSEIERKNIIEETINHTFSLMSLADGMLLYSYSFPNFNLSKELNKSLDSFISLVEVKK